MSVKFLSAILGPEMGASILWAPGKMRSFCRKTPFPRFRGGGVFWVWGGGGSADFIFMGAGIFLKVFSSRHTLKCKPHQTLDFPREGETQTIVSDSGDRSSDLFNVFEDLEGLDEWAFRATILAEIITNNLFRFSSYTLSLGQKCDGGHLF